MKDDNITDEFDCLDECIKNGWMKDDNITDEESLVKFAEYKSEFKRQQLNQFFVLHRQIIHTNLFFPSSFLKEVTGYVR